MAVGVHKGWCFYRAGEISYGYSVSYMPAILVVNLKKVRQG